MQNEQICVIYSTVCILIKTPMLMLPLVRDKLYIYTHTHIYIYIYMCVCVCIYTQMCAYVCGGYYILQQHQ